MQKLYLKNCSIKHSRKAHSHSPERMNITKTEAKQVNKPSKDYDKIRELVAERQNNSSNLKKDIKIHIIYLNIYIYIYINGRIICKFC